MQANVDPQSLSLVGKQLAGGRYRITAKLAEGGMGFVYRAEDQHLGSDVVIKLPRPEMIRLSAERFSAEIRSLVQFAHPHILRIIDVGEFEGVPFAVMQFLAGGTLEDRMRQASRTQRAFTLESLQHWLRPIALALDFIHSQSYVHRDVKPANILFDSYGNPFLSDFGVGKVISSIADLQRGDSLSTSGAIVGTPQYMAPELTAGNPFDGRADQYALAVCVYELLSGRRPFEGGTVVAIHIEQMGDGPPRLDGICDFVSAPLADAVHRGLSYSAADRFPTCVEFADAVLSAIGVKGSRLPAPAASGNQVPLLPRLSVTYRSELSIDDVVRTVRDNLETWKGELIRFDRSEIIFSTKLAGNWLDRLLKKSQGPSLKVQLTFLFDDEQESRLALTLSWPEDDLLQQEIESQANQLLSQLIVKLRLFPIGETKVEGYGLDTGAATAVIGAPSLLPKAEREPEPPAVDVDEQACEYLLDESYEELETEEPANPLDQFCHTITHAVPDGRACLLIQLDSPRICARFADSGISNELLEAFAEFALQSCRQRNGEQFVRTEVYVRFDGVALFIKMLKAKQVLLVAAVGDATSRREAAKTIEAHLPSLTTVCA